MPDANDAGAGVTRRGILAAACGGAAALAGCQDLIPEQRYDPPDSIRTRRPGATVQPTGTPPDGPFRRLYESTVPSVAAVRTGTGSGSCYASDADHLVTNQHVVEDAETVAVQYERDDWGRADVVATDVYSDLAVLADRDRPGYVDPLPLAGYPPAVGQDVAVIGAPFGLRSSFTVGTISGVDRALEAASGFSVPGAIQTDAAVNPGNSGGPLLSADGDVLGVVSAAGGENVGFGIPVQLVRRVVPALVEFGDYQHPFLGVSLLEVTPAVADANGLERARGVAVTDTVEAGPADGVLRASTDTAVVGGQRVPVGGDVIVEVNGARVGSVADLLTELAFHAFPGDDLPIQVIREGSLVTVRVTVGVRPPPGS
jgi:S1-C subfamily serine protease